jgi:hypothetical protein
MKKPLRQQLAQIEKDIEDHNEGQRIERMRADQGAMNWTQTERDAFIAARKSGAVHLRELLNKWDEIRREMASSKRR